MIITLNKNEFDKKMTELGFTAAEKASVKKKVGKLDKDLKIALIQYVNYGLRIVGIELEDGLNIEKITTTFNMNYISALLLIQLYRKDPVAAVRSLRAVPENIPAVSADEYSEICKRFGITDDDKIKYNNKYNLSEDKNDVSVDTDKK